MYAITQNIIWLCLSHSIKKFIKNIINPMENKGKKSIENILNI